MATGQRGGFLVEVGFVTALLAVVAAAAVPRVLQGSLRANEQTAIDTLHHVAQAQKALRNLRAIDCDTNGRGEFGFFGELMGTDALRIDQAGGVGTARLQPPLLSPRLGRVNHSRVSNRGYMFQMYLPDTIAAGVAENNWGGAWGCSIDASRAEQYWCCYAWPAAYGSTGKRVFFVNESAHVLAADNSLMHYSGGVVLPVPSAAFEASTSGTLDCRTAANTLGHDGHRWSELH